MCYHIFISTRLIEWLTKLNEFIHDRPPADRFIAGGAGKVDADLKNYIVRKLFYRTIRLLGICAVNGFDIKKHKIKSTKGK